MILAIQIIVIFLNLVLSIFVYSQNSKSSSNRVFSLMSLFAAIWGFTNMMDDTTTSKFWLDSSYAMGNLVITTGLIWTTIMIKGEFRVKKNLILILTSIGLFIISYIPGFIAVNYVKPENHSIPTGDPGIGLFIFSIYYLVLASMILWRLYHAWQSSQDISRKLQFRNIFYGATTTLVVTLSSSFVLPYFSVFPFGATDNAGFLIFLTFIAYSITKHSLFNIRVVAIELAIFALWMTILVRIILSNTTQEILLGSGFLLIMVVFGIIIIRGTLHEIVQRDHIERLTYDLKKTYDFIKNVGNDMPNKPADTNDNE